MMVVNPLESTTVTTSKAEKLHGFNDGDIVELRGSAPFRLAANSVSPDAAVVWPSIRIVYSRQLKVAPVDEGVPVTVTVWPVVEV